MKCTLAFMLLIATTAATWADVQPPTTEVPNAGCVTAECHADVKTHQVLHGPVNVDACDACHQLVDAPTHKYQLTRTPEELCGFCHITNLEGAKFIHEPMKTGQCLGCHEPHGGFDKNFLKSGSMGELCKTCHQNVTQGKSHIHGPVAAGACGACHQPHTSQNEHLLVQTGRSLCLNCHKEMDRQLHEARYAHEPVQDDCRKCHDAHAADYPMMTLDKPAKLCTNGCHEDVRQAVFDSRFKHSAVNENDGCVNCHTPHGGDLATLMKSKPVDVCLTCHDKPVEAEGRTVAPVTEITQPDLYKHGPVRDGSCNGCHNVHGSDVSRLLADPYPDTFYESFAVDKYQLCFECHDKQLVVQPTTTGLTGFRNGEENLHYLHVNKDKRGRSCRACHSTHASHFPQHIRESVPYGNWQLPVNFKPTEDGGSCAPGCHEQFSYSRTAPIQQNPPPDSTQTQQAPVP